MFEKTDLNILVSNVVGENHYSHCRLCLRDIEMEYMRFEDSVILDPIGGSFQPLSEILRQFIGDDVCDEISGIDAVCIDCVTKLLDFARFIKKCHASTKLLNKVFDNLANTLHVDLDIDNKDQTLYVIIEEQESKVVLINNEHKQTKNTTVRTSIFNCLQCDKEFVSANALEKHKLICYDGLRCAKCYETFLNESELNSHLNKMHKYKCSHCPQIKSTEDALKSHQDKYHSDYMCKECGKSFQRLDKLEIHEQKHNVKSECPKCGKTYYTQLFFLKHVRLCSRGLIDPHPFRSSLDRPYSCYTCDKSYSTSGGLRVHERFAHGNAKYHVCPVCNKKFTAPSYLKVHMIKHTGEKNFKCDMCGYKLVSKEALLYHKRRHTGDKPYLCHLCDERFVNSSARAEHVKYKHVGPTLMCEICSRKFVTPHFLKQHMKRHCDPSSKLYSGRHMMPPNMPGEHNMRSRILKVED